MYLPEMCKGIFFLYHKHITHYYNIKLDVYIVTFRRNVIINRVKLVKSSQIILLFITMMVYMCNKFCSIIGLTILGIQ